MTYSSFNSSKVHLTFTMLNSDKSNLKNSVDPDQLASFKRPADQDLHCFLFCLLIHANTWNAASQFDKK